MTEIALLADLATIFKTVDTASVLEAEDSQGITTMLVNVFEEGKSEAGQKPTGQRRNIKYYVYLRGQGGEAAYYMQGEPFNGSQRDVAIVAPTLDGIHKIYQSATLRQRTSAAILDAAFDIVNEAGSVTDHAKRIKWASDSVQDLPTMLNVMMTFICQNASVQSSGGLASDNDISWIINSSIAFTFELLGY